MLETPDRVRELQRKLYQKAKQELRKPLEEDDRKAVFGKIERTVVCPEKASMFSRSQSCWGKSQKPRSWNGREEGNPISEAH